LILKPGEEHSFLGFNLVDVSSKEQIFLLEKPALLKNRQKAFQGTGRNE